MPKQTKTKSASVRKPSAARKSTKTKPRASKLAFLRFNKKGLLAKKPLLAFVGVFAVIGLAFTFLSHASIAAYTPVYFIKTKNTANCRVEVHRATAASDYKKIDIASPTWFDACKDGTNGTWQMVNEDLYFIKTKNTAGTIEVHSATKASGYTSGIHSTTAIGVADGANGTFQMVGEDLYFIKTKNTSGTIEVHAVSRNSNYQNFSVHSATAYGMADADNGVWRMYKTDLAFVKTKNTGSGKIELHIATRGSNYKQFGLHTATVFGLPDRDNGTFWVVDANDDGAPDLGFVKKQNTGTGKVEAFFAEAPKYDTLAVAVPTWFSPADANNGTWYMDSQVFKPALPAASRPRASTPTAAPVAVTNAPSGGPANYTQGLLRLGSSGPAVAELQQRLANRGFWIATTGDFNQATDITVRSFQKVRSITVDGIVGPQTFGQLAAAEAEGWRFNPNDPKLLDPATAAANAVAVIVDRAHDQPPLPTADAINTFFAALRAAEIAAQIQAAQAAAQRAAQIAAQNQQNNIARAIAAAAAAEAVARQVRAAQIAQNIRDAAASARAQACPTPDWNPGDLIIVSGCTPGW